MSTLIHKLLWSIVCGTAVALGGCYESDDRKQPPDAPEEDTSVDTDTEDSADTRHDPGNVVAMYGPPYP